MSQFFKKHGGFSQMKNENKKRIMFFEKHAFSMIGKPNFTYWIPKYLYETKKYEIKVFVTNPFDKSKYDLPIFVFGTSLSFFKEFLKFKPDVLIVFQYFGARPIALIKILALFTGTKIVVVTDFVFFPLKQSSNLLMRKIRYTVKFIFKWFQGNTADVVICWTEFEKEDVKKRFRIKEKKFKVIPMVGGFEIINDKEIKKSNYILSVAEWRRSKNLHIILSVFNEIATKNKYVDLVIVGEIPDEKYKKEIKKILNTFKPEIKERIHFLGLIIDREKLKEIYQKAKIFYLPSKFESFGAIFVEALSTGLPIVAHPDSKRLVKDGYIGFLCEDEKEQKESIEKLLNSEKLYARMQENCLKEAEKYKWENIIKSWVEIIEQ